MTPDAALVIQSVLAAVVNLFIVVAGLVVILYLERIK